MTGDADSPTARARSQTALHRPSRINQAPIPSKATTLTVPPMIPATARQFTSPAMVAQQKFLNLPNADKNDTIRIDPPPEEQEAFDYLMRHLPPTTAKRSTIF